MIEALKTNNLELLENNIFNDLTEAALKTNNELNNIYNELRKNYDVHLSGAGPAMFIVNPNEKEVEKLKEINKNVIYIKTSIF